MNSSFSLINPLPSTPARISSSSLPTVDAKMQRMRQISDAYDSKLTTATMTNASAVQQHSGLVTSSSVPRAYIGLPGQVETPEAAFLSSQLATDAPRLAGYNAFEQLLAYRRYYPGCTNTIQLVTQCHVDLLYFDPNTISSAPTDFATVSGMKIKTDAGATTYEWDFTYNVKVGWVL